CQWNDPAYGSGCGFKGAARHPRPEPHGGECGEPSAARQGQSPLERGRRPLQAKYLSAPALAFWSEATSGFAKRSAAKAAALKRNRREIHKIKRIMFVSY